jgi:O-antigen/teichoic acid export membrane protein
MVNFKEHFKLTALYTFFAAFPAVLQLVVYPVIEGNDRLGAEDFGYLAMAEALLSFLVMFALYGMAITISRYYFEVKDHPEKYRTLVSTIFTGVLIRGVLLLGLVLVFADFFGSFFNAPALADFRQYGHYLAIIALNRTIIMVALALYRNAKMVQIFVIVSLLSGLARSVFQVVGVLYFDLSFIGYLEGTAIGGGIAALVILIHTYSKCGVQYSFSAARSLNRYALPLFVTDILTWGVVFFDRFLLMDDTIALGIYDNAIKFAIGVQFISQGLTGYVQPELYRMFNKGGSHDVHGIRSQSNLFMAENVLVIILMLLPLMAFIHYFYETELIRSAGILPIVLSKYVLYAQYQIFLWPVLFIKRSDTVLYVNILVLIVVVGVNLLLVPVWGYYGAITASIIGGMIQVFLFRMIQSRLYPISWNLTKVFYFPLGVVMLMVVLELLKLFAGLHELASPIILVVLVTISMGLMYYREIKYLIRKLLDFWATR